MMETDQLYENSGVRQRDEEGFRRWFLNSYFDLIFWYDKKDGELIGFQLCYSRNTWERAFTWTPEYTSSRLVSDTFPETGFLSMSTGILKGDGGAVPESVMRKFGEESAAVDAPLRILVQEKIAAYNASRAEKPVFAAVLPE